MYHLSKYLINNFNFETSNLNFQNFLLNNKNQSITKINILPVIFDIRINLS